MDNNNKILFPEIQPYSDGYLDLDGLHKMYWQQSGNPDGLPVVVIHGGPGAGLNPLHRRFFDPEFYRIIAYDQRGAGRSTPNGEVKDSTAQDLIEDIEKLKNHLGIDKWLVSGASWGSTLALLYAQHHPHSCLGLIVRSIFLGREFELHWTTRDIRAVFPDAWEKAVNFLPPDRRDNIMTAYHDLVWNSDPEIHTPAAAHYLEYFRRIATLNPSDQRGIPALVLSRDVSPLIFARLQTFYSHHRLFLQGYDILDNMAELRKLPGFIIHARYDMVCPILTAFDLAHQ